MELNGGDSPRLKLFDPNAIMTSSKEVSSQGNANEGQLKFGKFNIMLQKANSKLGSFEETNTATASYKQTIDNFMGNFRKSTNLPAGTDNTKTDPAERKSLVDRDVGMNSTKDEKKSTAELKDGDLINSITGKFTDMTNSMVNTLGFTSLFKKKTNTEANDKEQTAPPKSQLPPLNMLPKGLFSSHSIPSIPSIAENFETASKLIKHIPFSKLQLT